jgi:hypothetical protein
MHSDDLRLLLGLIAIAFALIGTTMPFMLPSQAAKDRAYIISSRQPQPTLTEMGIHPRANPLVGERKTAHRPSYSTFGQNAV